MKVLVAEDDAVSRAMLAGVLKKWGLEPEVVENGRAALEALSAPDAPKIAVLDWNMPELDGAGVCESLRKIETSDPPYLILLTARGDKDDIVRGLDAGANDYISKPFNQDELRARIRVGQRMIDLQGQLNRARDALFHEAFYDALTGVLNRRAILELLQKELARAQRHSQVLVLGMCDLDFFKKINDTYGHQAGDDVLREFAQRLTQNVREYDHIGRYGGEEFLLIAPGCSQGSNVIFERVRSAVADAPFSTRAGQISVTVSIGTAVQRAGNVSVDDLLARADAALYQAKREGRNRVAAAAAE